MDAVEHSKEGCPAASAAPSERGMTKRWCPPVGGVRAGLPLVARVMASRGLTGDEACARFLEPSLLHLHDPSLIPDLDRAAERILAAARAGERIVIYGDYDVDGITATSILYHILRELAPGCEVATYVPHRLEEGYGVNEAAIGELADAGARLIVTVDCGVTAVGPARLAAARGVDLIITDHHNPPACEEALPEAYAVVHPRHPRSAYPFGDLCGAGVAYKLAWRLATMACGRERVPEQVRALLVDLLAFAGMGVIADVVPLLGENRVIARHGLSRVRTPRFPGLRALIDASGLDGERVQAEDVAFRLAPRLNAVGRLGHAREAVELLTTARGQRAIDIARQLTRLNVERQGVEREIFEHASERAVREGMTGDDRRAIVLADPGWHAGVVGIVCARLVERFHRPTILMREEGGLCHGSGRSIDGFSLHGALQECAHLLTSFGGHDMAAGLKVRTGSLPEFVSAFTAVANRGIPPDRLVGASAYDCEARLDELERGAVVQLERLGPFGRSNPDVRVVLRGLRLATRPQTFGQNNKHLSLRVVGGMDSGRARPLRLVGWNWARHIASLTEGMTLDALLTPAVSAWSGEVEGVLVDVRAARA